MKKVWLLLLAVYVTVSCCACTDIGSNKWTDNPSGTTTTAENKSNVTTTTKATTTTTKATSAPSNDDKVRVDDCIITPYSSSGYKLRVKLTNLSGSDYPFFELFARAYDKDGVCVEEIYDVTYDFDKDCTIWAEMSIFDNEQLNPTSICFIRYKLSVTDSSGRYDYVTVVDDEFDKKYSFSLV